MNTDKTIQKKNVTKLFKFDIMLIYTHIDSKVRLLHKLRL